MMMTELTSRCGGRLVLRQNICGAGDLGSLWNAHITILMHEVLKRQPRIVTRKAADPNPTTLLVGRMKNSLATVTALVTYPVLLAEDAWLPCTACSVHDLCQSALSDHVCSSRCSGYKPTPKEKKRNTVKMAPRLGMCPWQRCTQACKLD